MKKNVLIISYSYPPSNAPAAQRPYALAKFLDKSKYEVTVISCSNADSSLGFDPNFDESVVNVDLVKIKSRFGKKASGLRESGMADSAPSLKGKIKKSVLQVATFFVVPDKAVFWYPNVISYLKKNREILKQADIVFTTSPLFSNHLIGKFVKKVNPKAKWIADFRDFHYVESWEHEKGLKSVYHKRLELQVIKRADVVTFISSAMQDVYAGFYPNFSNKMNFVYNGFDIDDFKDLHIDSVKNDRLTIFYAGSFYKGVRSPFTLLALLDESFKSGIISPEEVIVKIAGNFEQEILDEAKRYKSFDCIRFLGRIPRTEVLNRLTKSDLLWLIVGSKITHYTGVPIKFYEYLAARRPVINFAPSNSEPTRIIKELALGESFDTSNFILEREAIKFNKLISKYKDGSLQAPLNATMVDKFTRDKQTIAFQEFM